MATYPVWTIQNSPRASARARERDRVTHARAGHPKSGWSPIRFLFHGGHYRTRHARVRVRAIGWPTRGLVTRNLLGHREGLTS
eukprot:5339733-Pyramimonas_sp.AAC.1